MNCKTLTDSFTEEMYDLSLGPFSDRAIEESKNCILDYFASLFGGVPIMEMKTNDLISFFGSTGTSTVFCSNQKTNLLQAALINAMHAHSAELDDGHRGAMIHPGVPVISALFSIAEQGEINGRGLLKGVIVGYEAAIRLASALQPEMKELGYHGTGTIGSIGAAMGLAAALELSRKEYKSAFSAAITTAAGRLTVIRNISELKPYNAGSAAVNGIQAVAMAKAGFAGPNDVLGGDLGFLKMMSKNYKINELIVKPNDELKIFEIYRKPYASCRHSHAAIDAALRIRLEEDFDPFDIMEVRVGTYKWGIEGHCHTEIVGVNSAKMSTPYSVAVALLYGKAGIEEFSEKYIRRQEVIELTKKVTIAEDSSLTDMVPKKRGAIVTVKSSRRIYSFQVDLPSGEPENPMSRKELEEKFISLALNKNISQDRAKEIFLKIMNIENDLKNLIPLLK